MLRKIFAVLSIILTERSEKKSKRYMLNLKCTGNGYVKILSPEDKYKEGTKLSLIATPDKGFAFSHWEVNNSDVTNVYSKNKNNGINKLTINITRNINVEAIFVQDAIITIPEFSFPNTAKLSR